MTGQSESETDVIDIKDIDSTPKKEKKKKKSGQQFVCSYDGCKEVFKRLYRLNRHIRQHTGEVCIISSESHLKLVYIYVKIAAIRVSYRGMSSFVHL